ncbi:hypothetical protein HDU98_007182 [Podochytrium sp. JEL0797]|nr:hypothetical protein HDU98_007182 [Podochytrium sp. JEL0797]
MSSPVPDSPYQHFEIPLRDRIKEVLVNYLPLGFITFGGPQANTALLFDLFVVKNRWLSEEMFAELFAISNALPGPGSTQLAFTVALIRGGVFPGILAFMAWSLPGGIVMACLGYGVGRLGAQSELPMLVLYIARALAAVAIALVAVAAKQMTGKLLVDKTSSTLAAVAVVLVINFSGVAWLIPLLMACGGIVTYVEGMAPAWRETWKQVRVKWDKEGRIEGLVGEDASKRVDSSAALDPAQPDAIQPVAPSVDEHLTAPTTPAFEEKKLRIYFSYSMTTGIVLLAMYAVLLILSAVLRSQNINQPINIFTTFYFVGAIIFGGGPVVVPLLYSYVVDGNNWLSSTEFLMGFALINVMPGPNFNFAAFCGALAFRQNGWTTVVGAVLAWIGIFLPGLLVKAGVLPVWRHYRDLKVMKIVFKGLNSVAVGLLVAAVFLLWEKAIALPGGKAESLGAYGGWVGVMVVAFLAMDTWKVAPWWVVGVGAAVGAVSWCIDGRP